MKRLLLSLCLGVLLVPIAMAQHDRERGYDRGRDHGRNERRERVGSTIRDCEARTDEFKVELRRYLDTSRINGTDRERELNRDARALDREMNVVKEAWQRDRDIPRVRRHVSRAIDVAQDLNRTMLRHRMSGGVQRAWHGVRRDLNRLAEVFQLPKLAWRD